MDFEIKDLSLKDEGLLQIEWADRQMPVLRKIREEFEKTKPLTGCVIGACLHVTKETANLVRTLQAGGATVALCASNPLSTQDEVAAALVKEFGVSVFALRGESSEEYYRHIHAVLNFQPKITLDDGADLVTTLHRERRDQLGQVVGGTEETTTGVIRLRSMFRQGVLAYPIIAVNDAQTKYLFDNRYGTGQSVIDGILRATNLLLAGSVMVVAGYGWCGRGIAMRAKGAGARVIVTEVDPVRALEAVMDGYEVLPMSEAARIGDIFVTATGDTAVIREEHFRLLKDGAILCNAGHFDVEVDVKTLRSLAVSQRKIRPNLEELTMEDGRRIFLLAEGRLVNLAAAEGHPAAVMDMSFSNQALAALYLWQHQGGWAPGVYPVPKDLDERVARLKLESMGVHCDELTPEQAAYLASWEEGTA
ncbi:MAG: adenosylhomocysteinase [Armatimonadetes bacterium]|nr:adenosylhomocysteinase [Armatimonadota bacterium]MDW8121584.1 adenosylhomocysteinase [Armatimonadota bacterium]